MFQTTKTPVKIFRASDTAAPQIKDGAAGALKTLLKACLVTGYGENKNFKAPIGWEMIWEDTESGNQAAFRPKDETSLKGILRIDNTNANYVVARAYETMDENGNGNTLFSDGGRYDNFAYHWARDWVLIGHEKAFILLMKDEYYNASSMLYFGDVPSLKAGDMGNFVYMNTSSGSDDNYINPTSLNGGDDRRYFMRNATGDNPYSAKYGLGFISAFWNIGGTYPDLISGGMMLGDVYLTERGYPRGLWGGVLSCGNNLNSLAEYDSVEWGDGDVWLKCNLSTMANGDSNFLVNATAWEA